MMDHNYRQKRKARIKIPIAFLWSTLQRNLNKSETFRFNRNLRSNKNIR